MSKWRHFSLDLTFLGPIGQFWIWVKAWPNAPNISTQHLATLLHDVATCVEWAGQTHETFSTFSTQAMSMFICPWPRRATSGPSAHALVQQCCVNVAKREQHHVTSKMLHEKFDRFQIWSNIIQHVAKDRNKSQQGGETYATCCAQQCCKMLRWNVASVWPGLK